MLTRPAKARAKASSNWRVILLRVATPYEKPALTFSDQIIRLQGRGLVVKDCDRAERVLSHINYYRFAGYLLAFEEDHPSHRVIAGTTFEDVERSYRFDRDLRMAILAAVESIEISFRTKFAYRFAHYAGPMSYTDPKFAKNKVIFENDMDALVKQLGRSDEVFIKHLHQKYSDDYPPVWSAVEVMTWGLLSRWYENIGPESVRKEVAQDYGLPAAYLDSVLRHLSLIRNKCAHHSRLIDTRLKVTLQELKSPRPANLYAALKGSDRTKLYPSLAVLVHMVGMIGNVERVKRPLLALFAREPRLSARLGVPSDVTSLALWK